MHTKKSLPTRYSQHVRHQSASGHISSKRLRLSDCRLDINRPTKVRRDTLPSVKCTYLEQTGVKATEANASSITMPILTDLYRWHMMQFARQANIAIFHRDSMMVQWFDKAGNIALDTIDNVWQKWCSIMLRVCDQVDEDALPVELIASCLFAQRLSIETSVHTYTWTPSSWLQANLVVDHLAQSTSAGPTLCTSRTVPRSATQWTRRLEWLTTKCRQMQNETKRNRLHAFCISLQKHPTTMQHMHFSSQRASSKQSKDTLIAQINALHSCASLDRYIWSLCGHEVQRSQHQKHSVASVSFAHHWATLLLSVPSTHGSSALTGIMSEWTLAHQLFSTIST
jgi:hypothetical protein